MDARVVISGLVLLVLASTGCISESTQTPTQRPIHTYSIFGGMSFPEEIECEIDLGEIDFVTMSPLAEDIKLYEIASNKDISIESCTSPDTSDMILGSSVACGFFEGNSNVQSINISAGKNVTFVVRCFGEVMNATEGVYDAGTINIKALDKKENKEETKKIPLTVTVKPAFKLGKHWFSKENFSYIPATEFNVGDNIYLTTDIENDKLRLTSVGWSDPSGKEEWDHYPLYPYQTNFTFSKKLNMSGTWNISVYIHGYYQFSESIIVKEGW